MARRADQAPRARRPESSEVGHPLRPGRHGARRSDLVIFGSSNWTSPSAAGQVEHNIFTTKPDSCRWFVDQFERKWNNTGGLRETTTSCRCRPDAPKNPVPAIGATGVGTTVDADLVRRPLGAPVRPLPRHQFGLHRPAGVHRTWPRRRQDRRRARSATRCPSRSIRGRPTTGRWSERPWRSRRRRARCGASRQRRSRRRHRRQRRRDRALRVEGAVAGRRMARRARRHRRRRREDPPSQSRARRRSRRRSASPANYFELTFNAEAGRRIGSGSAARRTATTGRTTRCSCSSRLGHQRRRRRSSGSARLGHRRQSRGLQRLRRRRLGLAGQRLRDRRARPARLLRQHRPADGAGADPRGRLAIDQIVLSPATFLPLAGRAEERHASCRQRSDRYRS